MLTNSLQNVHHSRLPYAGTIGRIVGLKTVDPRRRVIVDAFPLCDSPDCRYSLGIHTFYCRFLDNGERARFAWQWFEAEGGQA